MCNIRKKTNDPNLRKFSDGWTDGQTNNQTDVSDLIGRCSTNVERPKYIKKQFHLVCISSFYGLKTDKDGIIPFFPFSVFRREYMD